MASILNIEIRPGVDDNYLVGYQRPMSTEFMPLADCNTWGAAADALRRFQAEARARHTEVRNNMAARGIRGFYQDNE